MAAFLLVHGSCHGAWCWRDVIPALDGLGHSARAVDLRSLMRDAGLAPSSSEAARLVAQGAVYAGDARLADPSMLVVPGELPDEGLVIRVGRRRFLRVVRD